MINTRSFSGKQLLIAFTTGAAAGAVVALITAPRSGKETRAAMQTWARDAREKVAVIPQAIRSATKAGKEAFAESYRGGNGHQGHA